MAINITNTNANVPLATPETLGSGLANSPTLTLALTPAALQSPELQALLTSIDPSQQPFSVAQRPLPFSQTAIDPAVFTSSLQSGSTGLQSAIDSLSQSVDADQNKLNADSADPNVDQKTLLADAQKLQEDMMKYQVMVNLQSTIDNIFSNLDNKIVDNSKLNG
jgi:hypothetical protein